MSNTNPYKKCPIYETESFILRLVEENDAEALFECYSDLSAVKLMNSDNCNTDFYFKTLEEMKSYLLFWLKAYESEGYVRFSIVDKQTQKAIGTIEMFGRKGTDEKSGRLGILRIDLHTKFEKYRYIEEILKISNKHFYDIFEVEHIITKAIPASAERVLALEKAGYSKLENKALVPYDDYYMR